MAINLYDLYKRKARKYGVNYSQETFKETFVDAVNLTFSEMNEKVFQANTLGMIGSFDDVIDNRLASFTTITHADSDIAVGSREYWSAEYEFEMTSGTNTFTDTFEVTGSDVVLSITNGVFTITGATTIPRVITVTDPVSGVIELVLQDSLVAGKVSYASVDDSYQLYWVEAQGKWIYVPPSDFWYHPTDTGEVPPKTGWDNSTFGGHPPITIAYDDASYVVAGTADISSYDIFTLRFESDGDGNRLLIDGDEVSITYTVGGASTAIPVGVLDSHEVSATTGLELTRMRFLSLGTVIYDFLMNEGTGNTLTDSISNYTATVASGVWEDRYIEPSTGLDERYRAALEYGLDWHLQDGGVWGLEDDADRERKWYSRGINSARNINNQLTTYISPLNQKGL